MEKANPRTSIKTTNSDPKVKQDVTNKHLRLPRVKESISPRPESRRKPNPQRNKELFDKRPRNRAGAVCERYRSEVTEEHVNEVFGKQGSKKINLNHLLNFTVAPPEIRDGGPRAASNRSKFPKYNKELFLQANCQFVARDNGNYSIHEKNPDVLVEWSLIEEIRLPSYEVPLCPICLFDPIAAKITRCGHIYCWPCILHYLALTDRTWQKCPICFEAVHKTELKSVSLRIQQCFNVGDEITMCLMKRVKGSLLTTPVTHENPKKVCSLQNTDDYVVRFQKLLLANKKDIYSIIEREQNELEQAYKVEKDTPEACFIESALKLLGERKMSMDVEPHVFSENYDKLVPDTENNNAYQHTHLESMSSTDSHDEILTFGSPDQKFNSHSSTVQEISHDSERKGISYFYQAEDGQHIYLHNINVRMLLKEYGTLENAPSFIEAKIVEIERVSMTDNLRKRLRYLQHLPLTCEFQIAELNFSDVLDKSTILDFEGEINKRKHLRNKKARNERRREKFIEMEENKKLGKYPKATYNLLSNDQFPSCDPSNFQPLNPPINYDDVESKTVPEKANPQTPVQERSLISVNSVSPTCDADAIPSTSFAQMLKDGRKTFTQIPKEKKKDAETPPGIINSNVDSDCENWIPPPEYHQSFSDAIQAALESVNLQGSAGNGQKSGKKKKGKKQLLFTTSMCRNK